MDILRPESLPIALGLAILVERLWEYFAKPLSSRAPSYAQDVLNRYGPAVLATVICVASGFNTFNAQINPAIGTALTALLIGGGSNLIHDVTQRNG